MRLAVETVNCAALISYMQGSVAYSLQAASFDKTFAASRGDIFALTAQSTCGAGGSATVRIYRDGTLLASDSKVGPGVARVSGSY